MGSVQCGHVAVAKLLCRKGADLDLKDNVSTTAHQNSTSSVPKLIVAVILMCDVCRMATMLCTGWGVSRKAG